MANLKTPISDIHFFNTHYIACDGNIEPKINDDAINRSLSVTFKKEIDPKKLTLILTPHDLKHGDFAEILAIYNDSEPDKETTKFVRFDLQNLPCKAQYTYSLMYEGKPVVIQPNRPNPYNISFKTYPARQDPQPLVGAFTGDEERNTTFGRISKLTPLDNIDVTRAIHEHIGSQDDIDFVGFLADFFNGEWYFSIKNILKKDRKLLEVVVKNLTQFRSNLGKGWDKAVCNNFSAKEILALFDDHDLGKNDCGPIHLAKDRIIQKAVIDAFVERGLMPDFLKKSAFADADYNPLDPHDIRRKGPYESRRIGLHKIYLLHARYTQSRSSDNAYLLGPEQWRWLEESLAADAARASEDKYAPNPIIVSPFPLVMSKGGDYREHPEEWERLAQLIRRYNIGWFIASDTHIYSDTQITVQKNPEDENPHQFRHIGVGIAGGMGQKIKNEEEHLVFSADHSALLPEKEPFDRGLYTARVNGFFTPKDGKCLHPVPVQPELMPNDNADLGNKKNTYGYLKTIIEPIFDDNGKLAGWNNHGRLFTVKKKNNPQVVHDQAFDFDFAQTLRPVTA